MTRSFNRKPSYEPEEVVTRRLIRFLLRLKILNREEHMDIIMRWRS